MILVVGGANLDSTLRTHAPAVLRTSNPSTLTQSAGGVGRNIAENLARLGDPVVLVAALGDDAAGAEVLRRTAEAGVDVGHVLSSHHATGSYVAILDDAGELVIGVSDMSATDSLRVADLAGLPWARLLGAARVLVLDGNLPVEVNADLLGRAARHDVPVVLDPVSVAKAAPLARVLGPDRPVFVLTPNVDELAALVGHDVPDDDAHLAWAAAELHRRGVEHVWIRRGPRGSALSTISSDLDAERALVTLAAPDAVVADVTGAGDSMTAGFVHAWCADPDVEQAARVGQAVASLTVESPHTVRPDLTAALVRDRLARSAPSSGAR